MSDVNDDFVEQIQQARDEQFNPGPNNTEAEAPASWVEQQVAEQINPGNSEGGDDASRTEAMNLGAGNFADAEEQARQEVVDHQINLGPNS